MTQNNSLSHTALLVIDVINGCCHQKGEKEEWGITFSKIRAMTPRLQHFITQYRQLGGQLIFINCVPWQEQHLAANIVELYRDPNCRYYSGDNSGFSEQFYQLAPANQDVIFTKKSYSAFTNPKLNQFLHSRGIKQIVIAGVFGDGCVEATIQAGFALGYDEIILKDLIETTDLEIRQQLQQLFKDYTWPTMFGPTINSSDFFDFIQKRDE